MFIIWFSYFEHINDLVLMGTYIVVRLEFMYVVAASVFKALDFMYVVAASVFKALCMLLELILSIYVFMLSIYFSFESSQ